jgi:hypothetical protein
LKRLKKARDQYRFRILTTLERGGYTGEIAHKIARDDRLLAEVCKGRWKLPDVVVRLEPLWIDWPRLADYADPSHDLKRVFKGPKKKKRRGDFYRSPEWLRARYEALKKYGRQCAVCGATPGGAVKMHVDHIKPRSRFPHLELSIDNLQVLCAACNLGKGNSDEIDWRKP